MEQKFFSNYPNISQAAYLVGIQGTSFRTTLINRGRSYGILGYAGNYTSGWNYGVYGRLAGDYGGAGVFGTIYGDYGIPSKFAGFFYGNVGIVGNTINYSGVSLRISDSRLKDNIVSLNENGSSLNRLFLLDPVIYDYKPLEPTNNHDTIVDLPIIPPDYAERKHLGFKAEELLEVYPELVYVIDDDLLSIDYLGFIPILVASINEQQHKFFEFEEAISSLVEAYNEQQQQMQEIESELMTVIYELQQQFDNLAEEVAELREIIENCPPCKPKPPKSNNANDNILNKDSDINFKTSGTGIEDDYIKASLYQNTPNPFNQITTISFSISECTREAMLYIYDMQGVQIRRYNIYERGDSSIKIQANEMKPGIYLYTLITDGKEVATKKMIITD